MSKEKELLKKIVLIGVALFYILPIYRWIFNNPFWLSYTDRVVLLIVFPIYAFVSGIVFTKAIGFKWYFALIIAAIAGPSMLLYYSSAITFYAIMYGLIALAGCGTGVIAIKRGQE